MDNPEKLATFGTQDGDKQNKQKILIPFMSDDIQIYVNMIRSFPLLFVISVLHELKLRTSKYVFSLALFITCMCLHDVGSWISNVI